MLNLGARVEFWSTLGWDAAKQPRTGHGKNGHPDEKRSHRPSDVILIGENPVRYVAPMLFANCVCSRTHDFVFHEAADRDGKPEQVGGNHGSEPEVRMCEHGIRESDQTEEHGDGEQPQETDKAVYEQLGWGRDYIHEPCESPFGSGGLREFLVHFQNAGHGEDEVNETHEQLPCQLDVTSDQAAEDGDNDGRMLCGAVPFCQEAEDDKSD